MTCATCGTAMHVSDTMCPGAMPCNTHGTCQSIPGVNAGRVVKTIRGIHYPKGDWYKPLRAGITLAEWERIDEAVLASARKRATVVQEIKDAKRIEEAAAMGKRGEEKFAPRSALKGVWLWLATDGEVRIAERVPDGGSDLWLGFPGKPPLTTADAVAIRTMLCDLAPSSRSSFTTKITLHEEPERWYFRSDPRTQGDLVGLFRSAVEAEAAKRGEGESA